MIYITIIILNIVKFCIITNLTNYNTINYHIEIIFKDSTNNKKRDSLYLDSVHKVIQYKTSNHILNTKNKGVLGKTLLYKN